MTTTTNGKLTSTSKQSTTRINLGPTWHFHLVNVTLHTLVTMLVHCLCTKVIHFHSSTALICSLLFATHPIHCEAVKRCPSLQSLTSKLILFLYPLAGIQLGGPCRYLMCPFLPTHLLNFPHNHHHTHQEIHHPPNRLPQHGHHSTVHSRTAQQRDWHNSTSALCTLLDGH